ncbi:MAG: pyrimidine 5'-nucleotidase [Rhodospirillales bacterium]|nr:pyrimidine 5'-nucleotidase [Rhodospirillales bacterium]
MVLPAEGLFEAEAWIFDLDNTLYPASCNLFAQIDVRMRDFIADYLDLDPDEAYRVQKQYFSEYGTTLRGLMHRHDMDPGPFLDHVHDIDLSPVLSNPELEQALATLPGRKLIFTNADSGHAHRVMEKLGVRHHFDEIFDIIGADYVPKPEPQIYHMLVDNYGLDPAKSVMVEDIARNLEPAAALGMTTIWVKTDTRWGTEGFDKAFVHHEVDDLAGWLIGVARRGGTRPQG